MNANGNVMEQKQVSRRKKKNRAATGSTQKNLPAETSASNETLLPAMVNQQLRKALLHDGVASPFERDSYFSTSMQEILDRSMHAMAAHFTGGLSPSALAGSYADWAVHLATSPGKQLQLVEKAAKKSIRLANYAMRCTQAENDNSGPAPCIEPLPQDKRFRGDAWQKYPYNFLYQSFLMNQQWWHNATTGVRGVTKQHENVVEFATRQFLDVFSPSNYFLTNPEVLEKTIDEGGQNLIRGYQNFIKDYETAISGRKRADTRKYEVGRNLAVTPGKVIYRNRLIELIQYEPATEKVRLEPILIVPAWIMKYYILDLSQENSLVKYLTEQGFTVFMISWKNPDPEDRDLSMNDYRQLGVMTSLDVIGNVMPDKKVHGIGYCLGGTLLTIAAAAMARDRDDRLMTLSLFAAQADFTEAGELMLFINESQVTFLEDMMWEQGFLDTKQMAGAFQLLRSNDLIWSRSVRHYLMGEEPVLNDLMTWNADATRMPYRMHSEYLRQLFLNNDLAEGRFLVEGRPIMVSDITAPIFAVGTERDHVAPWRSVYKYHMLSDTEITFLLTNGGHNAGIVSEPGHPRRHYRVEVHKPDDRYMDPEEWYKQTAEQEGSWWPEFSAWLKNHSGDPVSPPPMGAPEKGYGITGNAPGTYVFQE